MLSRLASRPLRAPFFPSSPSIRASICPTANALPRRQFSASAPRSDVLTHMVVAAPLTVLDTVHSLGVPWWLVIPLTATLVQCTFVYHMSALPRRKREITRAHLFPLAQARTKTKFEYEIAPRIRERHAAGIPQFLLATRWLMEHMWVQLRETHQVGKRFAAPLFTFFGGPVNFLTLMVFAEAIRLKCGSRKGLLPLLLGPLEGLWGGRTDAATTDSADEGLAQQLEMLHQERLRTVRETESISDTRSDIQSPADAHLVEQPCETVEPSYTFSASKLHPPTPYAELADPTMSSGGVAWFHDLTAPDMTHILPSLLVGIMLLGVKWSDLLKLSRDQRPQSDVARATRASGKVAEPSQEPASRTSRQGIVLEDEQIRSAFAKADQLKQERANIELWNPFRNLSIGDRIKIALAGLVLFTSSSWPVGILLYFMSNSIMSKLLRRWLDVKYPLPVPIRPCKRKMRIKVRTEFKHDI